MQAEDPFPTATSLATCSGAREELWPERRVAYGQLEASARRLSLAFKNVAMFIPELVCYLRDLDLVRRCYSSHRWQSEGGGVASDGEASARGCVCG